MRASTTVGRVWLFHGLSTPSWFSDPTTSSFRANNSSAFLHNSRTSSDFPTVIFNIFLSQGARFEYIFSMIKELAHGLSATFSISSALVMYRLHRLLKDRMDFPGFLFALMNCSRWKFLQAGSSDSLRAVNITSRYVF